MTKRFHLPVVVTTDDDVTREQVTQYVEAMLSNLEETDEVYRTFVEDDGIETSETDRLLDMLDRLSDEDIASAIESVDEITDDNS